MQKFSYIFLRQQIMFFDIFSYNSHTVEIIFKFDKFDSISRAIPLLECRFHAKAMNYSREYTNFLKAVSALDIF